MASSSFSVYSQPAFHSSETLNNSITNTPRPSSVNSIRIEKHDSDSNFRIISRLYKFPRPVHLFACHSRLPIRHESSSNLSPITGFPSHTKGFAKFLRERIVVLLVGSFVFLSFLAARPVVALPGQRSGCSENMEQNSETEDGNSEEEERMLNLLAENPRNVEALKVVLYGKMRKGKTQEAVYYVERLIDVEPAEVEWRLLQALCYEVTGQLSMAKKLYKEILDRKPLLIRALHGLAMVMHENHEGPAVFDMLNNALELAIHEKRVPEQINIGILIAEMHILKGELEEGLRKLQHLVDENPRDFRPYLCQGIIYSLLDMEKEAKKQFEMYQILVPDEFPQRRFLDDVALAVKRESREQLQKVFKDAFPLK